MNPVSTKWELCLMPCAGCCLMLVSGDCRVVLLLETHVSGRKVDRRVLAVPCGYFEHQRRVQFDGCVAEPLQTITAIFPWSKWSCLLLRIVLQDALSEGMKVCPPTKLMVLVDDITAFTEGRHKELLGIAEQVLKAMRREVEGQAVGFTPTERLKFGRQMAAAAGKKESVSSSLMEVIFFWRKRRTYPPWPRSFGRKACGWEDGKREQQKAWRK